MHLAVLRILSLPQLNIDQAMGCGPKKVLYLRFAADLVFFYVGDAGIAR